MNCTDTARTGLSHYVRPLPQYYYYFERIRGGGLPISCWLEYESSVKLVLVLNWRGLLAS